MLKRVEQLLGLMFGPPRRRVRISCPWHEELTPSCVVTNYDGVYCLGCGKISTFDELVKQLVSVDRGEDLDLINTLIEARS